MFNTHYQEVVPNPVIDPKTNKSLIQIVDEPLAWRKNVKNHTYTNVVIRIVAKNQVHGVMVEPILKICDDDGFRDLVISYLTYRAPKDKVKLRIPNDLSKHYKLVGADPSDMTPEELQTLKENTATFTEGNLYDHSDFRVVDQEPTFLNNPRATFFEGNKTGYTNDCLVHALNFALKQPYFKSRDQVMRLIA